MSPAEYEEADLFLAAVAEALPALRGSGSPAAWASLKERVDSARAVAGRAAAPEEFRRWVDEAVAILSRQWGARPFVWPARDPSLALGRRLYEAHCASCHGVEGRGDGPLAPGLEPPAANLSDPALLGSGPDRTFQVISYGIRGTAMAGWRDRLTPEERWDLTAYVRGLAGDSVSTMTYVRGRGVQFPKIHAGVERSVQRGLSGEGAAAAEEALQAYLEFEKVEGVVRAREPGLTRSLERDFLALRGLVRDRPRDATAVSVRLRSNLERAERALSSEPGRWTGVLESMTIIVREGFEAILIVGALLAVLTKSGHRDRRRSVLRGVLVAVGASLVTAVAVEGIFHWGTASREALEGITLLLATVVLFTVSYWLVSKVEHAAWDRYIRGKVRSALSRGSGWALASVGFLAVYREGFETVLFYKALLGAGPSREAVLGGFVVGCLVLASLFLLLYRFGVRIPLRPFFAVTSAVLYYMAFAFVGKGVHALQEARWLPATWVSGMPYLDWLGVYPTTESLVAQAVLVFALGFALFWIFAARPLLHRTIGSVAEVSREGSSSH